MKMPGFSGVTLGAALCLAPGVCVASEQKVFFHLHQAYEYFETFKKGRCYSAPERIEHHLKEAEGELGKLISGKTHSGMGAFQWFEPQLRQLRDLFKARNRVELRQIEEVRLKVQQGADILKLKHNADWHKEIQTCRPVG